MHTHLWHDFPWWEHLFGIMLELQHLIITDQRVPVVAEVKLFVSLSSVPLVDADELVVSGVLLKKGTC